MNVADLARPGSSLLNGLVRVPLQENLLLLRALSAVRITREKPRKKPRLAHGQNPRTTHAHIGAEEFARQFEVGTWARRTRGVKTKLWRGHKLSTLKAA